MKVENTEKLKGELVGKIIVKSNILDDLDYDRCFIELLNCFLKKLISYYMKFKTILS